MTLIIKECCLGYPDAEPCCKPVRYYALSAESPDLWNESAGASLGGYCCLEHANAELRPTYAAAEGVCRTVAENVGHYDDDGVLPAWQRLLEVFPEPIPVDA